MPAADVYLVRHAESIWNAAGRWQGQADPPLSDHGRRQAQWLAQHFPATAVSHIFTSDLERAVDTAAPLEQRFGLAAERDRNLRELDVGSWSGLTRAEIGKRDPVALDLFFRGREGWDGGETYAEHDARARAFVDRLLALDGATGTIAVTHGGTLRAIVMALLEIDTSLRWRFSGIGHTSVTHVTMGPHGYRLVAYNSVLEMEDV